MGSRFKASCRRIKCMVYKAGGGGVNKNPFSMPITNQSRVRWAQTQEGEGSERVLEGWGLLTHSNWFFPQKGES